MNIYTQLCGLAIIAILLFFYSRQPTMGISTERHFKLTLYVILGCVLLDSAACYFIVHSNRYSSVLVFFICKLYLISLQLVAFSALSYTISDIFENFGSKHEKMIGLSYQFLCLCGIAITMYLPVEIYYDGVKLYSYGQAAMCTYIFVACYIFSTALATIVLQNHIKQKKIYTLLIWMGIWTTSAIVQFFNPKILIVSFATCIGALIMYFELENPQSSISRRTGHFSSAVIRDYVDYLYLTKKKFSLLLISFKTVSESNSDRLLLRKSISMLSDFLFTIDTARVFDTPEGNFLLIFDNTDFIESTKFRISTYFQSVEDNSDISNAITLMNPFYVIVPDCNITDNSDELLLLLSSFIPNDKSKLKSNEIVVNQEVMEKIRNKKDMENLVVDAMEDNRVEVYYQPIFDISNNNYSYAEALVRIRLNDNTLVMPDEFIPIVEETGRIIPLSDSIYRKVLSFMKSYRMERLGVEHIELNLSVRQGEHPLFATRFIEMLKEYRISPANINLEINDTSTINRKDTLIKNIKKLEEYGLSFSLDDFGSGNTNLNYVVDTPVSIIKIDKHLTDEYSENIKAQAIIKTIIDLGHSMGMKIIAEGIETADGLETMKSLGVDYIQGFYFSKPLPEHEFLKFVQKHNLT